MLDLLSEVFPIETEHIPPLSAYRVEPPLPEIASRLRRIFPGEWVWVNGLLLTDTPVSPVQMEISLDVLRGQFSQLSGLTVREFGNWQISALEAAQFIEKTAVSKYEEALREALLPLGARLPNGYVLRLPRIAAWDVNGLPSLSVSVKAYLLYHRNLRQLIAQSGTEAAAGLRVMERTPASVIGRVQRIAGSIGQQRETLIQMNRRPVIQHLLREAAADDYLAVVQSGIEEYHYPASALRILADDPEKFGIPAAAVQKALGLPPEARAKLVKTVSDILKQPGLIKSAYNSRDYPHLFAAMDFMPGLVFADKRVRPYQPEALAKDFMKLGLYKRHPRFDDAPIRMAVINTLAESVDDFVEAMRRQIERDFGFRFEVIRERTVRVVSENNIASAVRVVEKENPHVVLAFFPDAPGAVDSNAEYLKSLTLGKGIASHAVDESTMHNPDVMPAIIMAVLAKTGNIPFALAEPLEYTDYVVGLDLVRERLSRGDRVVAMTRIYRSDGEFVRYIMAQIELERDESLPFVVLQTLFPHEIFENRRAILHHDGLLPPEIVPLLSRWGDVLGGRLFPVEILRQDVPRLYALSNGLTQPDWGSVFRLDGGQAFAVSSVPASAPRPLHIRVADYSLPVEQAVYSVLAWTLLQYEAVGMPRLPVTIQHAEDMAQWLARGMLPEQTAGDVPFWL